MNLNRQERTSVGIRKFAKSRGEFLQATGALLLVGTWLAWGLMGTHAQTSAADGPTPASRSKQKYKDFSEVTEGAKTYTGLFTLYEVDNHLYAELKGSQFNQMYVAPIAIARGMASAGTPLNFGDEWILTFRRVGDVVQLIRKNIHYQAPKGSPLEKAVEQNYTDSILMALPIVSINPRTQGVLIDFSTIFFSDFAQLGIGSIDRNRSSWHKIKAFDNNLELEVEATFGSRSSAGGLGDSGVVDPRGVTLVIHYSLAKRPEGGYHPRFADQRIGHFISATKDFGSSDPDTTFVRRINRWRLDKANPQSKLSPPKQQLVWWVENTVPHEYRPYVEEGILEWNKAFEKIGFRNAIGVRWQNDQDEFDPEDINYCTFRWITTPSTFAMSGLRSDPITGEIIDGDVIFDASWIRLWKRDYAFLVGAPTATGANDGQLLDVAEIISPMMAAKFGFGLPNTPQHQQLAMHHHAHNHGHESTPHLISADQGPLGLLLRQRLTSGSYRACQFAAARRHEYSLAAMALATRGAPINAHDDDDHSDGSDDNDDDDDKKDDDKDEEKSKDDDKAKVVQLPEELIGQAIKEVVMHEVGHSLGLRHNFKASAMLSLDQINDQEVTRDKGMVGSVMDYNPLNIARKDEKQGDFATTTIGPYDYWAIEYAYKPFSSNEKSELSKIAARSPDPDLIYATDEDLYLSSDPLVNTYDLGNDTLRYAEERIALAQELLKNLDSTVVRDGESWIRLREAFSVLMAQYGNAAYMATAYIGGQSFSRDFKGGDNSHDPITPVSGEKQREALDFVIQNILTDQPYQFTPELLRRLTTEYWYHWGSNSLASSAGSDVDIFGRVLRIQQIVLSHCLSADVLNRLQNQKLLNAADAKPLEVADVFRALTDGVWTELPNGTMPQKIEVSLMRRNLQRDHLRRLCQIVVGNSGRSYNDLFGFAIFIGSGGSYPADARSLARMHLDELHTRLGVTLEGGAEMDDTLKAHFQETRDLIGKVLSSQIESSVN